MNIAKDRIKIGTKEYLITKKESMIDGVSASGGKFDNQIGDNYYYGDSIIYTIGTQFRATWKELKEMETLPYIKDIDISDMENIDDVAKKSREIQIEKYQEKERLERERLERERLEREELKRRIEELKKQQEDLKKQEELKKEQLEQERLERERLKQKRLNNKQSEKEWEQLDEQIEKEQNEIKRRIEKSTKEQLEKLQL